MYGSTLSLGSDLRSSLLRIASGVARDHSCAAMSRSIGNDSGRATKRRAKPAEKEFHKSSCVWPAGRVQSCCASEPRGVGGTDGREGIPALLTREGAAGSAVHPRESSSETSPFSRKSLR